MRLVDGDEMKEAELLKLSAETGSHGREIAYEVKLEAGDTPADKFSGASLFVDDAQVPAALGAVSGASCLPYQVWGC